MNPHSICFISNRKRITLSPEDILYVQLVGRKSVIHVSGGKIYETYTTMDELAQALGSSFIRADRSCLVSSKAIHSIGKALELINGESLDYVHRRKRKIQQQLRDERRQIVRELSGGNTPATREEYRLYYSSFDHVPFAFTDIEMLFSEESAAVDWIFRYGNAALAELEKLPLEQLIDHAFGNIFPNMDPKWLRIYERAALYGETLEIKDYSPEIDRNLKVICFPTFRGHCGCMLFDLSQIQSVPTARTDPCRTPLNV